MRVRWRGRFGVGAIRDDTDRRQETQRCAGLKARSSRRAVFPDSSVWGRRPTTCNMLFHGYEHRARRPWLPTWHRHAGCSSVQHPLRRARPANDRRAGATSAGDVIGRDRRTLPVYCKECTIMAATHRSLDLCGLWPAVGRWPNACSRFTEGAPNWPSRSRWNVPAGMRPTKRQGRWISKSPNR